LHRDTDNCSNDGTQIVVFEAFETSATCEQVLASEGALQWDFPGQAMAVPYETFSNEDFQQTISAFLEQASLEAVKKFAAVTYKACAPLPEIRDTPQPSIVTGLLMAILEVNGTAHDTPMLRKRVRDTVSFNKAQKPWRRSAFYLVLRVAMQRHLYAMMGTAKGRLYYKTILSIFMVTLLNDGLYVISNEASHSLCQKLGRRLAKLEMDRTRGSEAIKTLHRHIFQSLRPVLESSLSSTAQFIQSQWEDHTRRTTRFIHRIQKRADPADITLKLSRSGLTLQRAMHYAFNATQVDVRSAEQLLRCYDATTALKPSIAVMSKYFSLFDYEDDVANALKSVDESENSTQCIRLARRIEAYIATIGDAYSNYPELRSRQILRLMELWMHMDTFALKCYPLLSGYHPGFDASIFDVLQLSTLEEMERLHSAQSYIAKRCLGHESRTIFDTPAEDSYAVRHYDASHDSTQLQELRLEIEADAARLLAAKAKEWQNKSRDHESKIGEMAGLSCPYETVLDENGYARQVHKKGCRKHRLKWEAKQMSIDIHEHPLPAVEAELKAVIFELLCPQAFSAYRDATWLILSSFELPTAPTASSIPLVRNYSGLSEYANNTRSKVTLGSTTKSHLDSHYATSCFPVPFREVSRAFGMKLRYFDVQGGVWASNARQPTLLHLFPLKLPRTSPYLSFETASDQCSTSNKILATQTKCPAELNVHEYVAWHTLSLGTHARWPNLLREMGSTNLNFSTDSTWSMVSKVCLQAGPATSQDVLRDTHSIIDDVSFCRKMLDQVAYRLEAIQRNWREPVQLDILMTILLRVYEMNSDVQVRTIALQMLAKARDTAKGWYSSLDLVDRETESGLSLFAIWAAVLYKRTFYPMVGSIAAFNPETLKDFILASIALHGCLVGNIDSFPYNLRNAILRDLHLAHGLRHRLKGALSAHEAALLEAVKAMWPLPIGCTDSSIEIRVPSHDWWATMSLPTRTTVHHIHYNLLYGTLLIDGQQLGMLPPEYRRSPIIQELFGHQALRTYPSNLPGMSQVISRVMPCGSWVHLGFRDGQLVVRASQQGTTLEFFSRSLFGNQRQYDLPASLQADCYHWLDLGTGILEIRQQDPWKTKKGNWRLNLRTRRATRNNGSTLVDPNSELAGKIARNFHSFEYPFNITVYQPPQSNLRVELKRLELDFVVMPSGLLKCPQLGAFIAETQYQDINTWYGLKSKLVVQSINDRTRRTVLVPFGQISCERYGPHVSVTINNAGSYLKFDVNDILGRIDCAADPVLLYHRAMLHALTAHFLPDPLTKRTGVEEALQYLQSGAYRPWTPLNTKAIEVLLFVAKLSPQRAYYPSDLKVMEAVRWNPELTAYIQNDEYRRVVNEILERNATLRSFSLVPSSEAHGSSVPGETHLENRALSRSLAYLPTRDHVYKPRDRPIANLERAKVAEITRILHDQSSQGVHTTQLASLLEKMPIIGGYVRGFDKVQITDMLEVDLGVDWGALVQAAIGFSRDQQFQATFLFSLLAFSPDVNMEVLRAIVSFVHIPDLKTLSLPGVAAYTHFRMNEVPKIDSLMSIMNEAKQPYVTEGGLATGQMTLRRLQHEKEASQACKAFAESFPARWPVRELRLEDLADVKHSLLDRDEAYLMVMPEWRRLVDNFIFSLHLEEVQHVFNRHAEETQPTVVPTPFSGLNRRKLYPSRMKGGDIPSLQEMLEKDLTALAPHGAARMHDAPVSQVLANLPNGHLPHSATSEGTYNDKAVPDHVQELSRLIAPYKMSSSMVRERYATELAHSISALSSHHTKSKTAEQPFNPTKLDRDLSFAKESIRTMLRHIQNALRQGDARTRWLDFAGLAPKLTKLTLLRELRSTSGANFGLGTREALVALAVAITKYQRLLRIQDAATKGHRQQMLDEIENIGHTNWLPNDHADWLLLEVESDIMLRPEQVDVALATISPESGENSVLQLLMGKGKTSCILPMVALALARKSLFRIVVPRPLLLQSAQIMQAKLGGLLDREIMHIPFSRKTPTDKGMMQTYHRLHVHVEQQNGIILALPEHILSFKLSGVQKLCDGKNDEAAIMLKTQEHFDRRARDVLDECDVSLAIRTQLIYPSGSQHTVDGHPFRWLTVQAVLDLVYTYLDDLVLKFPTSIEVVRRLGFPLVYFLRKDAEDYLVDQITKKICTGHTVILPVGDFSEAAQKDIQAFISVPSVDAEITARVSVMFKEKRHLADVVLHLRGLFVHRILISTLKKLWNVQYGLNPARDPIAVPYQVSRLSQLAVLE